MKFIAIVTGVAVAALMIWGVAAWSGQGALNNPQEWPPTWGGWEI